MVCESDIISILIADDHPIFGQALATFLECEPDITVVGHARDGLEALELFRQHQPDVVLMDLRMPNMEGVAAITAICSECDCARIIVLTTYDGEEDIYRGLQAGAKGYILKGSEPDELLDAIRTVYGGQKYIPPTIGGKLAARIGSPELSDRELAVLRLIAQGKSNQEISITLKIAESTVRFHINNILDKLNVHDRTQGVLAAINRGIVRL